MPGTTDLVLLDVNETLSDLSPLRGRFTQVGAPPELLEPWFAGTLRDGFALAATETSAPFRDVAAAVLGSLLTPLSGLTVPVREAVETVLAGFSELDVHPDVAPGLRGLRARGLRVVTLSNGSASVARGLLERAGIRDLVEDTLSVEEAGRWKPHATAYRWAADRCGVPLERCALVAVHPWDVHGAARAGATAVWLDRSGGPYPPVLAPPHVTVRSLGDVAPALVSEEPPSTE